MLDNPQHDFRTTELDPDLLSTPFKVQTNWHVITGAPSCGKTTLIDQLADKGFRTVPEIAHMYIEREMALGRKINEILKNRVDLQGILIDMQLGIEHELQANEVTFLDRALPDCLAFNRYVGLNPNDLLTECFYHRYASVFILDPLPFHENGVRDDDSAVVSYLDEWLARDYSALGYLVVRVPVLVPQERLEFVLERLSEQGLI
ncbi:MAG: ATP-binding protein [Anaerolineaceae bacterium]|nr:MAG: ATP-binding protein [Anaerolineaceae bacterium]